VNSVQFIYFSTRTAGAGSFYREIQKCCNRANITQVSYEVVMFEKLNRLALQLNWLVKVSTNNKEMIIEPYLQATIHVAHFRLSS